MFFNSHGISKNYYFFYLGSNLIAALSCLYVNNFSHFYLFYSFFELVPVRVKWNAYKRTSLNSFVFISMWTKYSIFSRLLFSFWLLRICYPFSILLIYGVKEHWIVNDNVVSLKWNFESDNIVGEIGNKNLFILISVRNLIAQDIISIFIAKARWHFMGADASTFRSAGLVLACSAAEYCFPCQNWCTVILIPCQLIHWNHFRYCRIYLLWNKAS